MSQAVLTRMYVHVHVSCSPKKLHLHRLGVTDPLSQTDIANMAPVCDSKCGGKCLHRPGLLSDTSGCALYHTKHRRHAYMRPSVVNRYPGLGFDGVVLLLWGCVAGLSGATYTSACSLPCSLQWLRACRLYSRWDVARGRRCRIGLRVW